MSITDRQLEPASTIAVCKFGMPRNVQSREYKAQVLAQELLELRDYLPEQTKRDLRNKLYETRSKNTDTCVAQQLDATYHKNTGMAIISRIVSAICTSIGNSQARLGAGGGAAYCGAGGRWAAIWAL